MRENGCVLIAFLCIFRVTSTYLLQSGDPGISFRQQTAPVQERIVNANSESIPSMKDTELSESHEEVECATGRIFYINQEGRLMRCDYSKLTYRGQPVIPQNSPNFLWPGLPVLGLPFWAGGRLPGASIQLNQDINSEDGDRETHRKKPVIIKPKPVLVKPVHKPIVTKPVHKPIVHKHPHTTHHHSKPCLHKTGPSLTAYHQTGISSVNYEQSQEEQFGLNPIHSDAYRYFYTPRVSLLVPIQAQMILAKYGNSNSDNHESDSLPNEKTGSDDLKKDESVRSEAIGNESSKLSEMIDDSRNIQGVNFTTDSSSEFEQSSIVAEKHMQGVNFTTNEEIGSDDLKEDELIVRSESIGNESSKLSQIIDDIRHIQGVNFTTNSSSEFGQSSIVAKIHIQGVNFTTNSSSESKHNSTVAKKHIQGGNFTANSTSEFGQSSKISRKHIQGGNFTTNSTSAFGQSSTIARKDIQTVNFTTNSSSEFNQNSTEAKHNDARNVTAEHGEVGEPQSSYGNDDVREKNVDGIDAQTESVREGLTQSLEKETHMTERPGELEEGDETKAEYETTMIEDNKQNLEKSLSEGPDVMDDMNGELDTAHTRKIREAPGIPIEILNDEQRPSSSILDRNTLLTIMSSLKEQYLKNAEPDQKKLIEDAFDRLHCSVRDMKKLDERPVGKKIDGSKRAALKLLAERAQPLMEEPDYYSDATDDVSAEPSFLELLNVATKHKGKQSMETE